MVIEGVDHSVYNYKFVTLSSFGVTRRHKVSGGIGCFAMCSSNDYQK